MDFEFSEEQQILRSALGQFCQRQYGFDARMTAARSQPGFRAEIWRALADDLGILGATIGERHGGMGGGAIEQMIVMEEVGRSLILEPLSETLFQAAPLLEQGGGAQIAATLSAVIAGRSILALAIAEPEIGYDLADIGMVAERSGNGWSLTGRKSVVMAAPWADRLIVAARTAGSAGDRDGISLFLVPTASAGIRMQSYKTIDERRAADIDFDAAQIEGDALIGGEGDGFELLEAWRDRAIAAQAAEAVGLLDRLVSETVAYTKQREQFGQPIAAFQSLQHRMVDMWIQVELVRAASVKAALALTADARERSKAASAAKVTLAEACRFVGQSAVQLHGGMGMTDELVIGHLFKRATLLEIEHGTADWHVARLADQLA
ncbi:MAG: acyl-CoA dehydrogenase family protein [Parasphingopyxis sp.]|uniref:acyl-CoA dehydrogenase family protein n=1 Tax=Parasphingopyxis sp. TaxID=1920299 RepID=UPI0032EBBCFC